MTVYQRFDGKVLNPPHKKLNKLNRNYFYLATILIVGLLCLSYFLLSDKIGALVANDKRWNLLFMPLMQDGIGDLVGNIIFFVIISIFLERHFGTIRYLLIVLLSFVPASVAVVTVYGTYGVIGFGPVGYFLLALMIVTMLFNLRGYFAGKWRWIFPIVILALLSLCVCWNGSAVWPQISISFGLFTGLVANWEMLAFGGIVSLLSYVVSFTSKKKDKSILKSLRIVKPAKNTSAFKRKKRNKQN